MLESREDGDDVLIGPVSDHLHFPFDLDVSEEADPHTLHHDVQDGVVVDSNGYDTSRVETSCPSEGNVGVVQQQSIVDSNRSQCFQVLKVSSSCAGA